MVDRLPLVEVEDDPRINPEKMMHIRELAIYETQKNDPEPGSQFVECPCCKKLEREILIVDNECQDCRIAKQRPEPWVVPDNLGWNEVRHQRDILIQSTDWTQLEDIDPQLKVKWKAHRKALRDITLEANPRAAWNKMENLKANPPK